MRWLIVFILAFSDAVILPEVAFLLQGDHAVFSCTQNVEISFDFQLQFKPIGFEHPIIFYTSGELDPAFANRYGVSFDDSSGYYNLTIRNVSTNDAGAYFCDWDNQPQKAELVVVDKDGPACDSEALDISNKDNCETEVKYKFKCSVEFKGNDPPTIKLLKFRGNDTFAPEKSYSDNKLNIAQAAWIQTISRDINTRYACQLPDVKRGELIVQSECNTEHIRRSNDNCTPRPTVVNQVPSIYTYITTGVFSAIVLVPTCLIVSYTLFWARNRRWMAVQL